MKNSSLSKLASSRSTTDQPAEPIVALISTDAARVNRLSRFFLSHTVRFVSFRSSTEYAAASEAQQVACLILDLELPRFGGGPDFLVTYADNDAPPTIVIADHGDAASGVRAMKSGAIDFLIEPLNHGELMAAVELAFAIDRKKRYERCELTALVECWRSLTPRETEVFFYTTAGLLNKQAAAELGVAENTYQVHRGRVMRKMKANSLADLVRMSTKLEPILRRMRSGDPLIRPSFAEERSSVSATLVPLRLGT